MKKLFVGLLCFISITSSAESSILCQNLFGESALNISIHGLAELRLELDLAQTSNEDSIAISLLKSEYTKKEKAILKYISQKDLLKLLKLEIEDLQKDFAKEDQARIQQTKKIYLSVLDGSLANFHPYTTQGSKPKKFSVMATPTTKTIWLKVAALIKYSEATKRDFDIVNTIPDSVGELHPARVPFLQVETWIQALNALSNQGEPRLKEIFPDHQKGDVYRLPSHDEWMSFLEELDRQMFTDEEIRAHFAQDQQDVSGAKPFRIQNHDYYVLAGDSMHWVTGNKIYPDDAESIEVASVTIYGKSTFNKYVRHKKKTWHGYERSTFRLVRERAEP